ncbi:D-alanyl-D-alanine carboxypeptidase family protein [Alkalicoccobacillus plakortidis]|uniref:D-alanyl-D-alanine carboxypeptidase n=1 Tax=Alkalicoccobacillus plakortidis TaxID=444060 RepID=A0ABT0XQ86_9BACI|nr:D-alanyl-D-alanine carboxypeptidase family protein [Alkalicoccobacillus plakortidis]MCM2677905.1 D-alanyl-D-alanine carboxypeptidase [Alkalicoccobacillus plakortidis]
MIKRLMTIGCFGLGLLLFLTPNLQADNGPTLLFDLNKDKNLIESEINKAVPVASISKMMTEYLVLEELEAGTIAWEDTVHISEAASSKEGARIDISEGDVVSVRDLYMAMLLPSANNATTALAEYIAGSEIAFTDRMNKKAQALGLTNTSFVNPTGLTEIDKGSNQMSAQDVALLAKALINDFPKVLQDTSRSSYTLAYSNERVHTTNNMLTKPTLAFDGLDGLKTGYTDEAGYCFVGTAERDGKRYISVVLGTSHYDSRFMKTQKLFSHAFNQRYVPSLEASIVKWRDVGIALWNESKNDMIGVYETD